jgi:hypothetical protein
MRRGVLAKRGASPRSHDRGPIEAIFTLAHDRGPVEADVLRSLNPTGRAFAEFKSDVVVKPEDLMFVPIYRIY